MLVRTDLHPEKLDEINSFVGLHGGGCAPQGAFTGLGWEVDGNIVGGLILHTSNGHNAWANVAFLRGNWNPRGLLRHFFRYCFDEDQLGLRRLTSLISEANISSLRLVAGLGFHHEATLREAEPEGDMHIYALFRENCTIWTKCHAKLVSPRFPVPS